MERSGEREGENTDWEWCGLLKAQNPALVTHFLQEKPCLGGKKPQNKTKKARKKKLE